MKATIYTKTLVDNYSGVERFDSLGDAIIEASEKEGIMVLADAFNALEETPEEKEEAPGTGDPTNVIAWLLMLLAGGFVLTKKRKEA